MARDNIFTFQIGIAVLYFHLGNIKHKSNQSIDDRNEYHQKALELIARPLRHLKGRRVTFLCGDAGPLALGAVLYERLGHKKESTECIKRYTYSYPYQGSQV